MYNLPRIINCHAMTVYTEEHVGHGVRRRRNCRICSLICLPVAVCLIWHVLYLLSSLTWSFAFDPTVTLSITVSSCDVHVIPCEGCSDGIIQVTQPLIGAAQSRSFRTGTDYVEYASFESSKPCDGPDRMCVNRCKVQVAVPASTTRVDIAQSSADQAERVVVTVFPGVSLATFKVTGHAIACVVRNATVSTLLQASSGVGHIQVEGSDIGTARLYAARNNVFFVTPPHITYASDVDYRSTSNYGCFAAAGAAQLAHGGVWERCSIDTEPEWGYSAREVARVYDPDSNLRLTVDELVDGMESLGMCCGPGCPFYSRCQQMHAYTYVPFGVTYTPLADFVGLLAVQNATSLVPSCHRRLTVSASVTAVGSASSVRPVRLTSDSGAVYFAQGTPQPNATRWSLSEGGSTTGLRLLAEDAQRLMTTLRDVYAKGFDEDVESIVAVLDIVPAPGVPRSRLLYTNQPVYLTLDPAVLASFSLGLLRPKVIHHHIHLAAGSCSDNELPTDPSAYLDPEARYADEDERLRQIGEQVYKALLAPGRTSIWGRLVLVNRSHSLLKSDLKAVTRDGRSGDVRLSTYQLDEFALMAFWTSLAFGLVGAALVVLRLDTICKLVLQRRLERGLLQQRVFDSLRRRRQHAGEAGEAGRAAPASDREKATGADDGAADDDGDGGGDDGSGHHDPESDLMAAELQVEAKGLLGTLGWRTSGPLSRPVELVDEIVFAPIAREFTDSLDAFIHQRCTISTKAGLGGGVGSLINDLADSLRPVRKLPADVEL